MSDEHKPEQSMNTRVKAGDRSGEAFKLKELREAMEQSTLIPVVARANVDEATAWGAQKLAGHKGNVLLEDVKPGQRVLLNATFVLGQPFLFEPDIPILRGIVTAFSQVDLHPGKDLVHAEYTKYKRLVQGIPPGQLQPRPENLEKVSDVMHKCELLAVLRQVLFDEPIPLIDIATVKYYDPSKGEESSSTKVRKIGQAASSGTSHADATSSGSKTATNAKTPQDKFRDPERVVVRLKDILPVEGLMATSGKHLQRSVDHYKQRLDTAKSAVQQDYRDALDACNHFVTQEGTVRGRQDWVEFITNCVHMFALRHVLHDKPLPEHSSETEWELEMMLQRIRPIRSGQAATRNASRGTAPVSAGSQPSAAPGGLTFDDMCKMDWLTVSVEECAGVPLALVTDGATMSTMRKKAEKLCRKDLTAAKEYFKELTKSCKKTLEDFLKLQDKAQIGIPKAVKELESWSQDCIYWCVLRRVLHNIPMCARPGRSGTLVDNGVQLKPSVGGESLIMFGEQDLSGP